MRSTFITLCLIVVYIVVVGVSANSNSTTSTPTPTSASSVWVRDKNLNPPQIKLPPPPRASDNSTLPYVEHPKVTMLCYDSFKTTVPYFVLGNGPVLSSTATRYLLPLIIDATQTISAVCVDGVNNTISDVSTATVEVQTLSPKDDLLKHNFTAQPSNAPANSSVRLLVSSYDGWRFARSDTFSLRNNVACVGTTWNVTMDAMVQPTSSVVVLHFVAPSRDGTYYVCYHPALYNLVSYRSLAAFTVVARATSTPTVHSAADSKSDGDSVLLVITAVLGSVLSIMLILVLIFFFIWRSRRQNKKYMNNNNSKRFVPEPKKSDGPNQPLLSDFLVSSPNQDVPLIPSTLAPTEEVTGRAIPSLDNIDSGNGVAVGTEHKPATFSPPPTRSYYQPPSYVDVVEQSPTPPRRSKSERLIEQEMHPVDFHSKQQRTIFLQDVEKLMQSLREEDPEYVPDPPKPSAVSSPPRATRSYNKSYPTPPSAMAPVVRATHKAPTEPPTPPVAPMTDSAETVTAPKKDVVTITAVTSSRVTLLFWNELERRSRAIPSAASEPQELLCICKGSQVSCSEKFFTDFCDHNDELLEDDDDEDLMLTLTVRAQHELSSEVWRLLHERKVEATSVATSVMISKTTQSDRYPHHSSSFLLSDSDDDSNDPLERHFMVDQGFWESFVLEHKIVPLDLRHTLTSAAAAAADLSSINMSPGRHFVDL